MLYILTLFLLSVFTFGEVPHSYVTENPETAITKVETIKEREKAELNLSVTKKKSKEIQGEINRDKKEILLSLPQDFINKSLVVVEGLEDLPNPSTIQGRKVLSKVVNNQAISENIDWKTEGNKLSVKYENLPQKLYISDLKGDFYKWQNISKRQIQPRYVWNGVSNIEIDDSYNGEWVEFNNSGSYKDPLKILNNPKGIKLINSYNTGITVHAETFIGDYGGYPLQGYQKPHFAIENKKLDFRTWLIADYGSREFYDYEVTEQTIEINKDLVIIFSGVGNVPKMKIIKYPKKDFSIFYKFSQVYYSDDTSGTGSSTNRAENTMNFKYVIRTLEGQSVLTAKEYYPVNQFIKFNSTTMEAGSPLALENSLRDVSLNTTGKGIVTMQQGDKLEIDGKQVVIGAGGNLAEQKATIGNLQYTYKVENGKLRLALNKWGVLEPDRNLMIRVWRNQDGAESKLVEHTLTVKAPRKVEGNSQINYNNDYQIRTFIRFGGISLTAPGISSLETPIPTGVTLSSQQGQGIPFMEEGDILEVNDGVTRAVHQFTIGVNGTLSKKQIKFNNSDVTLYVENGKLRAGLNNWIVNKPVKLNLRLIRGTNEIMNHAIAFKVPEAPFNIKENGLLDFGKVTAGSKRTAETNIVIEMMKDTEEVSFRLKDTQPLMENANGKQLKVKEIQTIVRKQGERTYLVKLHGSLVIPEDTQMGEYSGSTILELRIK